MRFVVSLGTGRIGQGDEREANALSILQVLEYGQALLAAYVGFGVVALAPCDDTGPQGRHCIFQRGGWHARQCQQTSQPFAALAQIAARKPKAP